MGGRRRKGPLVKRKRRKALFFWFGVCWSEKRTWETCSFGLVGEKREQKNGRFVFSQVGLRVWLCKRKESLKKEEL